MNDWQATADAVWDAGNLGCGELMVELRRRMRMLCAGQTLLLTAHDPAAPLDVRAWCRLTGHKLKQFHHPHYLIERKDD